MDDRKFEKLLGLFKLHELRRIADERDLNIKSNKPSDFVDALLEDEWKEEEQQELMDRLRKLREEISPKGEYILIIDQAPSLDSFVSEYIQEKEVQFDSEGNPVSNGFEVHDISDDYVEYTKWKVEESTEVDWNTGRIADSIDRNQTNISIDLTEDKVRISTSNYAKAKSVQSSLRSEGFEFDSVGHDSLMPRDAEAQVNGFIDDMKSELQEIKEEVSDV